MSRGIPILPETRDNNRLEAYSTLRSGLSSDVPRPSRRDLRTPDQESITQDLPRVSGSSPKLTLPTSNPSGRGNANVLFRSTRAQVPHANTPLLKAADQRFPSPADRCPGEKHELPGNNRKQPDQRMLHCGTRRRSRAYDQQKSRTPFRFALR